MDELNIILPVYNEKDTIEIVLDEWKKTIEREKIKYQFIICEDGSTDGTKELLKQIKNKYRLKLNQKKQRRGYGQAVIDGIKSSHSEYILCVDSDGQCDPADFSTFWLNRDKADVIVGWRNRRADPMQRKIFSYLFKIIFNLLFSDKIRDPSCPFVLFRKKTFLPYISHLKYLSEGFLWGFTGLMVKKKFSFYQIKIKHRKRFKGKTQVYLLNKIFNIAIRNIAGLFRLKLAKIQ